MNTTKFCQNLNEALNPKFARNCTDNIVCDLDRIYYRSNIVEYHSELCDKEDQPMVNQQECILIKEWEKVLSSPYYQSANEYLHAFSLKLAMNEHQTWPQTAKIWETIKYQIMQSDYHAPMFLAAKRKRFNYRQSQRDSSDSCESGASCCQIM